VPDTPQQIGVAKLLSPDLKEMARSMMRDKDVDMDLSADVIKKAVYIKNRVASRAIPGSTKPFELSTENKPKVSHMWVLRSTCWAVMHNSHNDGTYGDKAAKGVFSGSLDGSKAYKAARSSSHEESCSARRK